MFGEVQRTLGFWDRSWNILFLAIWSQPEKWSLLIGLQDLSVRFHVGGQEGMWNQQYDWWDHFDLGTLLVWSH